MRDTAAAFAYVGTQAIFAGTMFYGYHMTGSNWWWWIVALMATLSVKTKD